VRRGSTSTSPNSRIRHVGSRDVFPLNECMSRVFRRASAFWCTLSAARPASPNRRQAAHAPECRRGRQDSHRAQIVLWPDSSRSQVSKDDLGCGSRLFRAGYSQSNFNFWTPARLFVTTTSESPRLPSYFEHTVVGSNCRRHPQNFLFDGTCRSGAAWMRR